MTGGESGPDDSAPPDTASADDQRPVVAAFDVDGTITERDCVVPFMRRVRSPLVISGRLGRRPHRLLPAVVHRDRDRIKELAAVAAFRGLLERDVLDAGAEFARHVHDRWLRSDVIEHLRGHQAAGHTTVFVSASFEAYLEPLASLLGVDGVVATRLAASDGVLTGRLEGANCRGAEK
ncbi:MAG: HAD-IB family hydrolase, partial [Actinomycetota bacterium]